MHNYPATPEDFEMEDASLPLANRSLEDALAGGESGKEKTEKTVSITANKLPQWVGATIINLKTKSQRQSVPTVERLTAKVGIAVIREHFAPSIEEISSLRLKVYERADQVLLQKSFKGTAYELKETVGTTYRKISLREWTAAAINEQFVDPLGLPSSTAVELVLIAGISKSQTKVPRGWVKLANKELHNFQKYLKSEARRLHGEVLGGE
jgi:hypothetical protein